MLWAVSRAPLRKLQEYKKRMGWTFPWASSDDTDFNPDFQTGYRQHSESDEYNYRPYDTQAIAAAGDQPPLMEWAATTGTDWATYIRERPGMSAFVLDDGVVYHTYSTYARGLDGLWGMYQWLDRAPLGRNEARTPDAPLNWFRRHDEYA